MTIRIPSVIIDPRYSYILRAVNQSTGEPSVITPLSSPRKSIGSRIGLGMICVAGLVAAALVLA